MRFKVAVLLVLAVCCAAVVVVAQDGGAPVSQGGMVNTSSGSSSIDGMGIKKYLLGPGDVLDLRVYNEPQFNGPLVVDDEGNVAIPFIETPIRAQCRSDREIKVDVVKALAKYLNKPQVNLRLTEAKSRPPAIIYGAVRSPQRVQMMRKVKLLDVLASSGGVTEAAGGDIQIFHTEAIMCPDAEDLVAVPADTFKNWKEPLYFYNGNLSSGHYQWEALKAVQPKATLVCMAAGRIAKFQRDFPNAKRVDGAIKAGYDAWAATPAVKDSLLALAIQKDYWTRGLRSYDENRFDDPELKRYTLLCKQDTQSIAAQNRVFMSVLGRHLALPDVSDPRERYPLMDDDNPDHTTFYVNAVYAARQNGATL